jgi:peroxidase
MRSRGLQLRSRQQSAALVVVVLLVAAASTAAEAKLSQRYYASSCPNVEKLVRGVVTQKLQETFNAAPGTLRLFFHDCFVRVRSQLENLLANHVYSALWSVD